MGIIRNGTPIVGSKRLGATQAVTAACAMPVPDPADVRASLQAAFAEDLEGLREAARREGLLTAEAEIEACVQARVEEMEREAAVAVRRHEQAQAEALAALREAGDALRARQDTLLAEAQAAALEIAFQSVLKLLGRRVAEHSLLAALVEQALREHALSGEVHVTVAPAHADALRNLQLPGIVLVIEADAAMAPDACRLSAGDSRVDAGLGGQLARLRDAFLASLEA